MTKPNSVDLVNNAETRPCDVCDGTRCRTVNPLEDEDYSYCAGCKEIVDLGSELLPLNLAQVVRRISAGLDRANVAACRSEKPTKVAVLEGIRGATSGAGRIQDDTPQVNSPLTATYCTPDAFLFGSELRVAIEIKLLKRRTKEDANRAAAIHRGLGQCVLYASELARPTKARQGGEYIYDAAVLVVVDEGGGYRGRRLHKALKILDAQPWRPREFWLFCLRA